MTPTVSTELLRFLRSLLLGVPCGMLLELLRTLRALLPHHPIAVFLEDTLFSFGCCFLLQCYAWSFCGGVLRWQYAFGGGLGLCLWLLTAGAVWKRILIRLRRFGCILTQKITAFFVDNTENPDSAEKFSESS